MNASQNAEQFHAQLAQYVPLFSPDYWPVWLVVAGLMLVGMWPGQSLLCRQRTGNEKPAYRS